VTLAVVVSGAVSEFEEPSVRDALTYKVATALGVPQAAVTLTVSAASVRLRFAIALPSTSAALAASQALSSELATAHSATTFLSTPARAVTVVSIDQMPSADLPPPPPAMAASPAPTNAGPPAATSPPPTPLDEFANEGGGGGAGIAIAGGGAGGALLLLLLLYCWRRSKATAGRIARSQESKLQKEDGETPQESFKTETDASSFKSQPEQRINSVQVV
jgi:hypothetical protein